MRRKMILTNVLIAVFSLLVLSVLNEERLLGSSGPNSLRLKKLPHPFDFDGPFYPNPSLVFEGPFPKVPKKMMVYRVKNPKVTESTVRELGQKFGIPADAKLKRSRRLRLYWLKGPAWDLEVDPVNGAFNLTKIKKKEPQATTEKDYPSKEDCNSIAVKYLTSHNLLHEDAYLRGVVDNTKGFGVMSIGFGRKIGRYKTYGAGARVSVGIGSGGKVVEVWKAWQQLVPYKSYPIKTPQKALEELQNAKGVLMNGCSGKVNKITLRYYTSPVKQDFVQPIYYFECISPKRSFNGIVPAIKQEYLKSYKEIRKETEEKANSRSK